MTINALSDNLRDKSFHKAAIAIRKRTEVQQLNLETRWTDYLQERVDFGNKHLLKGFQFRLLMEDE